jgi:LAO/AO transport system kinase
VLETRATDGYGVPELWQHVLRHRERLGDDGLAARRRDNLRREVFALASARAASHLTRAVQRRPELLTLLDEVGDRRLDPLSAVREILERVYEIET